MKDVYFQRRFWGKVKQRKNFSMYTVLNFQTENKHLILITLFKNEIYFFGNKTHLFKAIFLWHYKNVVK